MKVIIASDSFKGSLGSAAVANACAAGIKLVSSDIVTQCLEVADGGEGTSQALTRALRGETVSCQLPGPTGTLITAQYGIVNYRNLPTAIIDTASAAGLTLVAESERDIMRSSTAGVGCMVMDAFHKGCRRFLIGLGGSATCDGGIGMLSVLGGRFIDERDNILPPVPASLESVSKIDTSDIPADLIGCEFILLSDVLNPICGASGAARIFAPQKGASQEEVEILDRSLAHFAKILSGLCGKDLSEMAGGGAAGGLSLAFVGVLGARIESGAAKLLDVIGFDDMIRDADLAITGEGKIDRQTSFGKLPYEVMVRCRKAGVPAVAIAGIVEDLPHLLEIGFAGVFPITSDPREYPQSLDTNVATCNIRNIAASIANFFFNAELQGV